MQLTFSILRMTVFAFELFLNPISISRIQVLDSKDDVNEFCLTQRSFYVVYIGKPSVSHACEVI